MYLILTENYKIMKLLLMVNTQLITLNHPISMTNSKRFKQPLKK